MQSQENNETDSGTFTVIEASLANLSFITSMDTKCDKDLISVLQKEKTRRRKKRRRKIMEGGKDSKSIISFHTYFI